MGKNLEITSDLMMMGGISKDSLGDSPLKSAKHDRSRYRIAHAHPVTAATGDVIFKHRQGDEAREPEQHGQGVEAEDDELVGIALEESGREGEVWQNQQGPDGDEDQESDFGRNVVIEGIIVVNIGRCAGLGEKVIC